MIEFSGVVVVSTEEELENELKRERISGSSKGRIFLWNGKKKLYEVLENLSEKVYEEEKIKLRMANFLTFTAPVTVYTAQGDKVTCNTLKDILVKGKNALKIVVESNRKEEVIALMQAFADIGVLADVSTREEIVRRGLVEEFYKNKEKLVSSIAGIIKKIEGNPALKKRSSKFLNGLREIYGNLTETDTGRTIRLAVFATKKSGKSMLVNALLGEEYAPTSQELATPNLIRYIPHKERFIKLVYSGAELTFPSAKDVRDFIMKEFKKVNVEGKKLGDMTIYYPCFSDIRYEIWDTPGPDLAGSEHAEVVKKVIDHVDVAVFVIDYTKYAQSSEIKLLKSLKNIFDRKGKTYSLICAVNKIDMMFIDSNVEKLRIRVTHFMRDKFQNLGFSNYLVIPITALIYFYMEQVEKRFHLFSEADSYSSEVVRKFMKENKSALKSEDKTYLGQVRNYLQNIEDTFEDISRELVEKEVGFYVLKKYIDYITQEKAFMEKIWSLISRIDRMLTKLENRAMLQKLLRKDAEKIRAVLDEFLTKVAENEIRMQFKYSLGKAGKELREKAVIQLGSTADTVSSMLRIYFEQELNSVVEMVEKLSSKLESGVISRDNFVNQLSEIHFDIESVVRDVSERVSEDFNMGMEEAFENFRHRMIGEFEEIKGRVKKAVDELNENLSKGFSLDDSKIKLPEFDISFDSSILREKLKDEIKIRNIKIGLGGKIFDDAIEGGFFRWLGHHLFDGDRYSVDREIIIRKIREKFSRSIESLKLDKSIRIAILEAKDEIAEHIEAFIEDKEEEVDSYLDAIYVPIRDIKEKLKKEQEEKEEISKVAETVSDFLKEVRSFVPKTTIVAGNSGGEKNVQIAD